jgi:CHAT domain-containing protein
MRSRKDDQAPSEEITRLDEQGLKLTQDKRYREAISIFEKSLKLAKQHFGEMSVEYADHMTVLGNVYAIIANYAISEQYFKNAIAIYQKVLGESNTEYIIRLKQILTLEINFLENQFQEFYKKRLLKEALHTSKIICEKMLQLKGENNPDYIDSLYNLASIYREDYDYANAEMLYKRAMNLRQRTLGENNIDFAHAVYTLAGLYSEKNQYDNAEPLYQRSLEIIDSISGKENVYYAHGLNSLGELYLKSGKYDRAELFLRKAAEIRSRIVGQSSIDFANSVNNLGVLYRIVGDYDKSIYHLAAALKILSPVYKDYVRPYHICLANLASVSLYKGEYRDAISLYSYALKALEDTLGQDNRDFAETLRCIGSIYYMMGDLSLSEQYLKEAMKIQRRVLGENDLTFAASVYLMGKIYFRKGDLSLSEQYLKEAMKIQRRVLGENDFNFAFILNLLSEIYAVTDRPQEALNLVKQSVMIENKVLQDIFSFASEYQRLQFVRVLATTMDNHLSVIFRYLPNYQAAICAAFDIILQRKAIGIDFLTMQRRLAVRGDNDLREKLVELIVLDSHIAERLQSKLNIETEEADFENMKELYMRKELLEREVATRIPKGKFEEQFCSINRKALAEALDDEGVLIEIIKVRIFDVYHYLAFILFAHEPDNIRLVDLGKADLIDKMIIAFRISITGKEENRNLDNRSETRNLMPISADISSSKSINSAKHYGSKLREAVFDKLIVEIGDRKRLFIAPDGELTRIPFEALPLDKYGKCLIDDYTITYLSTARDILHFSNQEGEIYTDSLVIANPDFNLAKDNEDPTIFKTATISTKSTDFQQRKSEDSYNTTMLLAELPGTEEEGKHIAEILGVSPKLGADALKSRLEASISPRILHIATHGCFEPTPLDDQVRNSNSLEVTQIYAPTVSIMEHLSRKTFQDMLLRSWLALAGANARLKNKSLPPEAKDGILTAKDVTFMALEGTRLVVLSACETGLGDMLIGEGVFGLRRSFVLAGAQTLVLSLWKVPDDQTKELMVDFYGRILSGKGRAEALREAQLAIKEKHPNPYYWGAFICQGNPSPLLNQQMVRK